MLDRLESGSARRLPQTFVTLPVMFAVQERGQGQNPIQYLGVEIVSIVVAFNAFPLHMKAMRGQPLGDVWSMPREIR